mmetsp:Transcript_6504/g.19732  ORF Transcript_6504/g.19732 Transcript_6504/m.19732 type:complete len:203 (-) Transcript_6504:1012-1620(-)
MASTALRQTPVPARLLPPVQPRAAKVHDAHAGPRAAGGRGPRRAHASLRPDQVVWLQVVVHHTGTVQQHKTGQDTVGHNAEVCHVFEEAGLGFRQGAAVLTINEALNSVPHDVVEGIHEPRKALPQRVSLLEAPRKHQKVRQGVHAEAVVSLEADVVACNEVRGQKGLGEVALAELLLHTVPVCEHSVGAQTPPVLLELPRM